MDGDDRLARGVAVAMLVLFAIAQLVSYFDRGRDVPAEMYPLATIALGYLLGYRLMNGKGNGKGKE